MPNPTGINNVPPEKPLPFPTSEAAPDDAVRPQTGRGSQTSENSLPLGQREVNSSDAASLVNPVAADIHRLEKQYVGHCNYQARLQEKQIVFQQLEAIRTSIADPTNFDVSGGFAIKFVTSDGNAISVLPPDPTLAQEELDSLLQRLSSLVGKSGDTKESGELEEVFGKGGQKLEESLAEVQEAMTQCRTELERLAPGNDVLNYQPEPAINYELSPAFPLWPVADVVSTAEAEEKPENSERFVFIPIKDSPEPSIPDREASTAEPRADSSAGSSSETTSQGVDLRKRLNEDNLFDPDAAREILETNKPQISRERPDYQETPCTNHVLYNLANDQASDMFVYLESSGPEQGGACMRGIIEPLAKNLSKRLRGAAAKDLTDTQVMNMIYKAMFACDPGQLEQDADFTILLSINNTDWLINRRQSRNIRTLYCAHQQPEQSGIMEMQADNTDPAVVDRLAKAIHQVDDVNPAWLESISRLPAVTKLPSSSESGGHYLLFEGSGPDQLMSDEEKLTFFRRREGSDPKDVAVALREELDRRAEAKGDIKSAVVMNISS